MKFPPVKIICLSLGCCKMVFLGPSLSLSLTRRGPTTITNFPFYDAPISARTALIVNDLSFSTVSSRTPSSGSSVDDTMPYFPLSFDPGFFFGGIRWECKNAGGNGFLAVGETWYSCSWGWLEDSAFFFFVCTEESLRSC